MCTIGERIAYGRYCKRYGVFCTGANEYGECNTTACWNSTIEAEPVRHGKWVVAGETTHYYICSICGKPGDGHDNYCRSCGALMDIIQGKADK